MTTYTVLLAEDVPHYGTVEISADSDAAAIEAAGCLDADVHCTDPDWSGAVCRRIVHIQAEDGRHVATDVALDNCFLRYGGERERRLCEAAPRILEALVACAEQLEHYVYACELDKDEDAIRALSTAYATIHEARGRP